MASPVPPNPDFPCVPAHLVKDSLDEHPWLKSPRCCRPDSSQEPGRTAWEPLLSSADPIPRAGTQRFRTTHPIRFWDEHPGIHPWEGSLAASSRGTAAPDQRGSHLGFSPTHLPSPLLQALKNTQHQATTKNTSAVSGGEAPGGKPAAGREPRRGWHLPVARAGSGAGAEAAVGEGEGGGWRSAAVLRPPLFPAPQPRRHFARLRPAVGTRCLREMAPVGPGFSRRLLSAGSVPGR